MMRTVFREKGYWTFEMECTKWGLYVCRADCGTISQLGGNMPSWKEWQNERNSQYDELVGYGDWSNVNAPSGPYDLDIGGGGPKPRTYPRLR